MKRLKIANTKEIERRSMSGVISYSRDFSEYLNMLSHKLRRTVQ